MPQPPATPRRRDGQPVQQPPAERVLAGQRQPAAPVVGRAAALIPAATAGSPAAAALLSLLAARQAAPVVAGGGGTALATAVQVAAITRAAAGILQAFDHAQTERREELPARVESKLEAALPDASAEKIRPLVKAEIEREKAFNAKARARMERDLPTALAVTDPEERRTAVRKILERETRYAQQREDAIKARAGGRAALDRMRRVLEPQGVTGMFWRLDSRLEHCARCMAMGGRIWPWTVLELYHPPQHLNCGCTLWDPENAFRLGWATPKDVASVDESISMVHLLEATVDTVWDPAGLWLLEADLHGRS